VTVIYDLELLMFWNKNKNNIKYHLLYAKNVDTEENMNFRSLSQLVKKNHKKVKREQMEKFQNMKAKIENLKEEIKQTMREHVKDHKSQLNHMNKAIKPKS
jgi:hypothetical protein